MIRKERNSMPEKDNRPGETGFRQIPGRSMVMLRGDLGDSELAARLASAIGAKLPRAGQIVRKGGIEVAWMSPDELLVMPANGASKTVDAVNKALKGLHVLVADVSDMRVEVEISGPVRDILAKGTPSDMSPGSFGIGEFRRSRIGQVQAAFWLVDDVTARIICRRSEAEYLNRWLELAIADGSELRFYHS